MKKITEINSFEQCMEVIHGVVDKWKEMQIGRVEDLHDDLLDLSEYVSLCLEFVQIEIDYDDGFNDSVGTDLALYGSDRRGITSRESVREPSRTDPLAKKY
jgi:hypothetical protein